MRTKHYPPGQDDARAAKSRLPFWEELAQPGYAGIDSRRRCGLVVICPQGWEFIPPIKLWLQILVDKLTVDVTLDGGQSGEKKTWQPADALKVDADIDDSSWISEQRRWEGDLFLADNMLDNTCFYNPRAQYCHDSLFADVTFDSGIYRGVVVIVGAGQDNFLADVSVDSGAYVLVVLGCSAPPDNFLADVTCDSGVYSLKVVVGPVVQDDFTADATADSGAYIFVVGAVCSWEDKMTADVSLASGSYA
jgi:hypothetical protein